MLQFGDCMWLGTEDGFITILSISSPKDYETLKISESTIGCFVQYHDSVWSGNDDGIINIFSICDFPLVAPESSNIHFGSVNHMQFVGGYIWTVSKDSSVIVWDPSVSNIIL